MFNPLVDRKYSDFARPYKNIFSRWEFTANFAYIKIAGIQYAYPVVYGIDLSHYNLEPIDYEALYDGGWRFVIHKATEGETGVDSQFENRYPAIVGSGLIEMAYGFSRQNQSGIKQAEHLLRTTEAFRNRVNGHTILMDDTETQDGASVSTIRTRILSWHSVIRANIGDRSMEYSSPGLWYSLTNNMVLPDGIWQDVAHWTSAENPTQPIGWNPLYKKLWQIGVYPRYSWCPRPPGWPVNKPVDIQVFFGTEAQLRNWVGEQTQPKPETISVRVDTGTGIYEGLIPKT